MPRGGARPGAGRPRKNPQAAAKKAPTKKSAGASGFTDAGGKKAEDAPKQWPFGTSEADQGQQNDKLPGGDQTQTPLEFLLSVMRDPEASASARMTAAIQAAPYVHAKIAPKGKKEAALDDAKARPNRFSAAPPPKLVAAGGKKV